MNPRLAEIAARIASHPAFTAMPRCGRCGHLIAAEQWQAHRAACRNDHATRTGVARSGGRAPAEADPGTIPTTQEAGQ